MRQRESRRTSFVLTPSRSERSGLPRSTTRDYGRTIGLKIHTSRYDAENENSSGSSRRVPPNAFFRSTPLSTMLFTSNAIFYRAAPSRRFEPRRLPSGGSAASQPDLGRGEFQPTDSINVSMPFKLCQSASKKWRRLVGSHHIAEIVQVVKFKGGEKLIERAA